MYVVCAAQFKLIIICTLVCFNPVYYACLSLYIRFTSTHKFYLLMYIVDNTFNLID